MLLLTAGARTAEGDAIEVEPGVGTLQEAVADAEDGDTLVLQEGVYVVCDTIVIDKSLTIKGEEQGAKHVVIVPGDEDACSAAGCNADCFDEGHILFFNEEAEYIVLKDFSVMDAPIVTEEGTEECPDNLPECQGDGIHAEGVESVTIKRVDASLNSGSGVYIDGAEEIEIKDLRAVANGAFGIDVDSVEGTLEIEDCELGGNGISGLEAAGHEAGTHRSDYVSEVFIEDTVASYNSEIGIETERFAKVTLEHVEVLYNREDGYDADRVGEVELRDSKFCNNLGDGIELFPVDVPSGNQPMDFPGNIIEDFQEITTDCNNVEEEINRPATEN
jgi:hypothetical protein